MTLKTTFRLRLQAIILAFVLMPSMASAQKLFRSYSKSQGVCDNSICCTRQDANGFLWIGTFNGLCRYDGNNFTSFFHDDNDASSISNSVVRALCPMDDGIWIATDNGIDFYSMADGLFHHATTKDPRHGTKPLKGRFNHIVRNSKGVFAVSNDGKMYRCMGNDRCFSPVNQHGMPYNAVTTFRDDMLAATGPRGVCLLADDGETVIDHLPLAMVTTSLVNIYYSKNKNSLYVGYGIGYKSLAFRIENNRIKPSDEPVPNGLMATTDYGSNTVFGIDGGGITVDNGVTRINYNPYNSNISGDAVYSLFVDRQENLWIGTYRMGLNLYTERFRWFSILNRSNHQLSYDIVTAIIPTENQLYIGLDGGGLELYDRKIDNRTTFTTANSTLPGNNITSMIDDGEHIWLTVYTKGLVRYSKTTHTFKTFPMPTTRNDAQNLWTMRDDGKGNIWLVGPDLFVFDKHKETIERVDIDEAYGMGVAIDNDVVWVACRYKGLMKIDRRSRRITKRYTTTSKDIKLPNNNVCFLFLAHDGSLWISCEHSGFYKMEEKNHKLVSYGSKQGLDDANVTSMVEDEQGNIVVGTYDGLYLMAAGTEKFTRLNVDDEVSEYTYNSTALDNGITFFGTTKGLIYFDISKIRFPGSSDEVFFQSMELLNDRRTLNLYTSANETVHLDHDENFFMVRFSSPDFVTSNRIAYSCRLEGFDTQWREASNGTIEYTKVPPGKYQLQVKATSDGVNWSDVKSLDIVVTPPWYLSWWAKLLAAALVVGAAMALVRSYLHTLNVRHRMEIAEVEKQSEKRLNEAKMDFYTSIVHELRTPIFLIMAQIEEILEEGKDPIRTPRIYISDMQRNANRLNKLVSRIVDFRKIGAENLKLELKRQDVVAFCRSQNDNYSDMFAQKDIEYTFVSSDDEIMLDFDRLKLELVISNLMTNAFKYTKNGGKVTFTITNDDQKVCFAVKDTGIGIDERYRDTIFESFFRSERGKRQSKGDGLGLSYVKNLVELHGGRITVDTEMGKGSTFTFFIPKREPEEHLQPLTKTDTSTKTNPTAIYTMLIVDDEPDTVQLLERGLGKEFRTVKAYDGEEGLQTARETLPDIIVCDLTMPRLDGQKMISEIRADKTLKHTKIIVFTANTSEEEMMQAFDNGADAYLTKPVSLKLLRKRIDKLLQNNTHESSFTTDNTSRRYSKEEQHFILKCRNVVDENICNPDFNIDVFTDKMAMSHSALYKKIKQTTGMSLIEFINDYRIYKATQLFAAGETSVKQVAEQCGISDPKTFRNLFKKYMKVTPTEYIQNFN
ncbi:MAG: ATP-binding protein [Prevotella sp.]